MGIFGDKVKKANIPNTKNRRFLPHFMYPFTKMSQSWSKCSTGGKLSIALFKFYKYNITLTVTILGLDSNY